MTDIRFEDNSRIEYAILKDGVDVGTISSFWKNDALLFDVDIYDGPSEIFYGLDEAQEFVKEHYGVDEEE